MVRCPLRRSMELDRICTLLALASESLSRLVVHHRIEELLGNLLALSKPRIFDSSASAHLNNETTLPRDTDGRGREPALICRCCCCCCCCGCCRCCCCCYLASDRTDSDFRFMLDLLQEPSLRVLSGSAFDETHSVIKRLLQSLQFLLTRCLREL